MLMAAPDTHSRVHELVFGVNVTFHPVGNIPISSAVGAGSPNEQVRQHINALFREADAGGKPHLLPEAQELLRQYEEFVRSGQPEPPMPASDAGYPTNIDRRI
jgi:hypothetical protein